MKQERRLKLLPIPTSEENALKNDQEQRHITFRYDPELEPGRYLSVPCDFLCSMHLSPTAKVLYLVLCSQASRGVRLWPSQTQLCYECAADAGAVRASLSELVAAGLISCKKSGRGDRGDSPSSYFVHGLHGFHWLSKTRLLPGEEAVLDIEDTATSIADDIHIPFAPKPLNQKQIQADTELLISKVGISKEAARGLAQLAAQRGCSEGYVAEVVEYATTTPGIKNPAGCVVQLIRRGESRKPGSKLGQQGVGNARSGLDEEKYTSGKYAFLFQRQNGSAVSTGVPQEGSGQEREEKQDAQEEEGGEQL